MKDYGIGPNAGSSVVNLDALAIIVGWPLFGSVEPAGPGRVVLRHEHGAAGIDLADGPGSGDSRRTIAMRANCSTDSTTRSCGTSSLRRQSSDSR
jgi:hypothetical protein